MFLGLQVVKLKDRLSTTKKLDAAELLKDHKKVLFGSVLGDGID